MTGEELRIRLSQDEATAHSHAGNGHSHESIGDDHASIEFVEPEESLSTDERRAGFARIVHEHAENPPGGDPWNRAFYQALNVICESDPTMLDWMIAATDARSSDGRPTTKVALVNILQHATNLAMIFGEHKMDFPRRAELGLHEPEGWIRLLYGTLMPKYHALYIDALTNRDIQTTHPERGVLYPLIAERAFGGRADYQEAGIRVLDLGGSTGKIWGDLVEMDSPDFHRQSLMRRIRGVKRPFDGIEDMTEDDAALKGIILEHAQRAPRISHVINVDRTDALATVEAKQWLLACRHFGEVTPEALRESHRQIMQNRRDPRVDTIIGDFLELPLYPPIPTDEEIAMNEWDEDDAAEVRQSRTFDMITASMTLYIQPKDFRDKVIADALRRLHPRDGILVVTDYIDIDHEQNRLNFTKTREQYACKTAVRGPATGDNWIMLAEYENTRARKLRALPGLRTFMDMTQTAEDDLL
jgi:hypothetical protein